MSIMRAGSVVEARLNQQLPHLRPSSNIITKAMHPTLPNKPISRAKCVSRPTLLANQNPQRLRISDIGDHITKWTSIGLSSIFEFLITDHDCGLARSTGKQHFISTLMRRGGDSFGRGDCGRMIQVSLSFAKIDPVAETDQGLNNKSARPHHLATQMT
jgi:hypothetical protein